MNDALIMLTIFSVPLTAIVASTWLKAQKLRATAAPDPLLTRRLEQLESESRELRQRCETLETIVTGSEWDAKYASRVRVQPGAAPRAPDAAGDVDEVAAGANGAARAAGTHR